MKYLERCIQAIIPIETDMYITDTKGWTTSKDYAEKVMADLLVTGWDFNAQLAGNIDPYQLSCYLFMLLIPAHSNGITRKVFSIL